ncbi:hypothetical protein [Pseudomonas sp. EMN2]|uniref:hypothetical protein n=1 Tax=Pseudomonas sp. EMN2 TaxID=2615212 RepID=UPI00129BE97D|nr:hypothetical protein [Pseudomonas sp. EMN2]
MKKIGKAVAVIVAVAGLAALGGCSAITELEARAVADRAANPAKYLEDPDIKRAQMTQNEGGAAYPEFCTFGCPKEPMDLTRNH